MSPRGQPGIEAGRRSSLLLAGIIVIVMRDRHDRAARLIEDQLAWTVLLLSAEVEHVRQRPGNGVKRSAWLDALTIEPIVLDEAQDRGLVDQCVVNEVLL